MAFQYVQEYVRDGKLTGPAIVLRILEMIREALDKGVVVTKRYTVHSRHVRFGVADVESSQRHVLQGCFVIRIPERSGPLC